MERRDPSRVGDLLRQHRTAAALSQEALAERAGLSVRAISDLERGVHQAPRLETVRLLADALGLGEADRAALLAAARPQSLAPGPRAARAARSPRAWLPVPPTRLIGRETEVAALSALLAQDDVRLVTLTGPGGTGKTRLALAVAAEVRRPVSGRRLLRRSLAADRSGPRRAHHRRHARRAGGRRPAAAHDAVRLSCGQAAAARPR